MSRGIKVNFTLSFAPDFKEWPRKTFAQAMEVGLKAVGTRWYREFLPKHFTRGAAQEYGHAKRTPDWNKFKIRKERRQPVDLVGAARKGHKAGTLKREVLRAGEIRATSKTLRVKFSAPGYVKFRGADGNNPDMVKELTTVSKGEANKLLETLHRIIAQVLAKEPKKKRIKR